MYQQGPPDGHGMPLPGPGHEMRGPAPGAPQDLPEEVIDYLRHFRRAVEDQNVGAIHHMYETGFPDLSERYFRDRYWPEGEKVAEIVGAEPKVFIILYKELYYRYLYAKMQRGPTLEHRYYSYYNYQDFFMFVLDGEQPQELNLPNQWLWDIIDEFVYQFQSFCQYKANPSKRTPEELKDLQSMDTAVWNLYPVLNILYQLINKSQINQQLAAIRRGQNPHELVDEYGRHPLYFKLGYFSLIGLLRLQTMLGDYQEALDCVKNIEFEPKGLYNRVPNCLVTVHYFVGFCRMIQGQYADAARIFVNCMLTIQRTRNMLQQQTRATYQYDIISKTNEQLYQLLAICLALQPQRIDESIQSQLVDRVGDRLGRLQRGEVAEFEATFHQGCPKFLNPTQVVEAGNFGREPTQQQTRVFMEDVKQQISIPALRGYLKLYSTMPISKLASFMDVSEGELVGMLLAFKHKMTIASRDHNSAEDELVPDIDFYVDKDMIHIAGTTIERRHCDYFIKQINKFTELCNNQRLSMKSN